MVITTPTPTNTATPPPVVLTPEDAIDVVIPTAVPSDNSEAADSTPTARTTTESETPTAADSRSATATAQARLEGRSPTPTARPNTDPTSRPTRTVPTATIGRSTPQTRPTATPTPPVRATATPRQNATATPRVSSTPPVRNTAVPTPTATVAAVQLNGHDRFTGGQLVGTDNEPLGDLVPSGQSFNSICDPLSNAASQFADPGIFNPDSDYGGLFGTHSPFNLDATAVPEIVVQGKTIAYLTVSPVIEDGVTPAELFALLGCPEMLE